MSTSRRQRGLQRTVADVAVAPRAAPKAMTMVVPRELRGLAAELAGRLELEELAELDRLIGRWLAGTKATR